MKTIITAILTLLLLSTSAFAAKKLDEENIAKMLDMVKIAKEHKNIKAMSAHFLSRASISLTVQDIETSNTERYTLYEYQNFLVRKWANVTSNLIEVKSRTFNIDEDGKSALVKTTLVQTIETNGVKTAVTIYETTGVALINNKIYIKYYSARTMANTAMRVN